MAENIYSRLGATPIINAAGTFTIGDDDSVSGTYRGVSGKFGCTENAGCVITRSVTSDADNWYAATGLTFTPTLGTGQELADIEVEVTTTTKDADYVRFGYWMTTMVRAGKTSQVIDAFADAMGYGALASDVSNLTGKATYTGGAAGIYVHKAGADDSLVVSDGEFVAAADLTAQFGVGDGSVAAADQWAVTGTVSGFQSTTGDHDLSDWTLMLKKADLGTRVEDTGIATATNADFVGFTGDTSGGTGTTEGEWSATFFGGAPADGDTTVTDDYPTAAIGEFNGHFSNGHVAGAFGVEKDAN